MGGGVPGAQGPRHQQGRGLAALGTSSATVHAFSGAQSGTGGGWACPEEAGGVSVMCDPEDPEVCAKQ